MIDPRGLTVDEWCDYMTETLEPFLIAPKLTPGMTWWEWANQVVQAPGISAYNPPDPNQFDDWQVWATRFIQIVPLAG